MKKNDTNKSGFTLVEAMVSLVILTLVIGGSLATFGLSMRSISSSNKHLNAVHSLRAVYEQIGATVPLVSSNNPQNGLVNTTNVFGNTVTYIFSRGGTSLRRITLSTSYTTDSGKVVTRSMQGMLGETLH